MKLSNLVGSVVFVFAFVACGDDPEDPCQRCAASATCTESGACECPAGFAGDGLAAGAGCSNIDECTAAQSPCAAEATCADTEGSYTCTCLPGYSGDGRSCADVDECAAGTPCGTESECRNVVGSFQCRGLYAPSAFSTKVYRLEPSSLAVLETLTMTLDGGTVTGVTSFAEDPTDGSLYAVLKVTGGRALAHANFATKMYTMVAPLSDRFASITFDGAGQLYGVTGDGATARETLYRINKATGEATMLRAFGAGADGEVIQWNPNDGHLYHWSGGTSFYEKVSMDETFTITSLSSTFNREVFGARWDPQALGFIVFDIASAARRFATDGTFTSADMATFPDDLRSPGTAVASEHRVSPSSGPAAGGTALTLTGAGFTAFGESVTVSFGGATATATVVDDTHLTVTSPAGAAGAVDLTISTNGLVFRWPAGFTYAGATSRARTAAPKLAFPTTEQNRQKRR